MYLLQLFRTDDQVLGYLDNHVLNLSSRIGREVFALDRRSSENYQIRAIG
jgi:hypothetical protein